MPRPDTKQALLVSLLGQAGGASSRELAESTGWKPNTVHSALATLRKSGWLIEVATVAGEKRYEIRAV
jgi:DNA-binding IclR family transcriptional regulator